MPREETQQLLQDGRRRLSSIHDCDAASVLRRYARAIPVYGCELWHATDEASRRGRYHDEQRTDEPMRDTLPMSMLRLMTTITGSTDSNTTIAINSALREGWLVDKLEDTRRKWMITLRRYLPRQNPTPPKSRQQDGVRLSNEDVFGEESSNGISSDRAPKTLVCAADVCRGCSSAVDVELEYTVEGVFIAENRLHCAACEKDHNRQEKPASAKNSSQSAEAQMVSEESLDIRACRGSVRAKSFSGHNYGKRNPFGVHTLGADINSDHCALTIKGGKLPEVGASLEQFSSRPDQTWTHESIRATKITEAQQEKRRSTTLNPGKHEVNDDGGNESGHMNLAGKSHGVLTRPSNSPDGATRGVESEEGTSSNWAEEIRARDEQICQLKQQLMALGEQPMEEVVSLQEGKQRLREAIDALMGGDSSTETEQALQKWDRYVTNHPDHIKEQEKEVREWEEGNAARNAEALNLMKTFVPPEIFHAGLAELRDGGLSPAVAKRVFERKVLWLIRAPEGIISRTHVVELKSKFVANDLDIVESRALHACLPNRFENDADGAKFAWREGFRKRLRELLAKEAAGGLKPQEMRHPTYKDISEGPFNPEAAFVELETTRSTAFDTVVKPAVSPMGASKISVLSAGLSTKLKERPRALDIVSGLAKAFDEAGEISSWSAPNSPASKYRRKSFVQSRGQPSATSMKEVMSELGFRVAQVKDRDGIEMSLGESSPPRGKPGPAPCDETVKQQTHIFGNVDGADSASFPSVDLLHKEDEHTVVVVAEVAAAAYKQRGGYFTPPTSSVVLEERVGDGARNAPEKEDEPRGVPTLYNMKDVMSELAAKAETRKEQSLLRTPQASPLPLFLETIPTLTKECAENPGTHVTRPPVTYDSVNPESISVTYYADTPNARQERRDPTSSLQISPIPSPQRLPRVLPEAADGEQDADREAQMNALKALCITEVTSELTGNIREGRFATAPSSPPAPLVLLGRKSMSHENKISSEMSNAREPTSMQAVMLELSVKAKARKERLMTGAQDSEFREHIGT